MLVASIYGLWLLIHSGLAAAPAATLGGAAQTATLSDAAASRHVTTQAPESTDEQAVEKPKPRSEQKEKETAAPQSSPPEGTATSSPILTQNKKRYRKSRRTIPAGNATGKVVVRRGGAPDTALTFSQPITPQQAVEQRENTTKFLAASSANLKQLTNRHLNSTQQDTVAQIRSYMDQAEAADKSGDVQRAQTLASKAKQISDDLVKH